MKNNKTYKIVIPILCGLLVIAQVVCFVLGIAIELNAIIDIIAVVVSLVFVLFLKEGQDIEKTKEEVKTDIKEGMSKLEEVVDFIKEKKNKEEWRKVTLFLCIKKIICIFIKYVYNYINSKKLWFFKNLMENNYYDV